MVKYCAIVIKQVDYAPDISSRDIIHHKLYDTEEAACKAAMSIISRYQIVTHANIKARLSRAYDKYNKEHKIASPEPFCYKRKSMRRKINSITTRKKMRAFAAKYIDGFNSNWTYQICEFAE